MITTRAREGGPKEHRTKQKWQRATHSVTCVSGLSTLFDLSRIDPQPPPSFHCCPITPSHHPSSLTSVFLVPALHLHQPSTFLMPYGTRQSILRIRKSSINSGHTELIYFKNPEKKICALSLFFSQQPRQEIFLWLKKLLTLDKIINQQEGKLGL